MQILETYHIAWLQANQKDEQWLRQMLTEGFHVHHIDHDHQNDDPENLVLIFGPDHLMLHGCKRKPKSVRKPYAAACGCACQKHGRKRTLATCEGSQIEVYSRRAEKDVIAAYHAGILAPQNGVAVL